MPSQQAEIAETIAALRRALDREKKAPSTKPIYSATNRGHKLYRGAEHVRTGVLAYTYGPERYKEKIEHAGYTRHILDRNPERYDNYGNELEESEEDEEADVAAAEQNPYSGILLEELLCPLKHPAELATHPTLSRPYLDPALPDMVRSTEKQLQQERTNLWRAKNLHRQFVGDIPWMPCGSVEAEDDWDLFEPRKKPMDQQVTRKRKRGQAAGSIDGDANAHDDEALPDGQEQAFESQNEVGSDNRNNGESTEEDSITPTGNKVGVESNLVDKEHNNQAGDVEMHDVEDVPKTNGESVSLKAEEDTQEAVEDEISKLEAKSNGEHDAGNDEAEHRSSGPDSPPQPTRRITRALAAETNGSTAPTPPLSPTSTLTDSSTSSLLQPDPLYLLPPHLSSSVSFPQASSLTGLSAAEAKEIRKLLTMYIQKQEESVRGYEQVLAKLIKAKRMRDEVFEMCKAEGHVGEMSDGEDWIDHKRWGLVQGELRKGKDEDDEGEDAQVAAIGGRKGKRRRN